MNQQRLLGCKPAENARERGERALPDCVHVSTAAAWAAELGNAEPSAGNTRDSASASRSGSPPYGAFCQFDLQ